MEDLGSDTTTYLLLFLIGLFSVGVQSFKLYGTPLGQRNSQRSSLLFDSVPLISLGGAKPFITGFVCYLFIIEVLYIVLSTSTVVLELALGSTTGSSENVVGGMTEPDDSGLKVYVPILASQLLVTLSQIRPFSEIENMIRKMSHHIAGIPQNIYDINDRISSFNFMVGDGGSAMELVKERMSRIQYLLPDPIKNRGEGDKLQENLVKIYSLQSCTVGSESQKQFAMVTREALAAFSNPLNIKFESFDLKIEALVTRSEERLITIENDEKYLHLESQLMEDWQLTIDTSEELSEDFSALFSLLYLNQPKLLNPTDLPFVARLVGHIRSKKKEPEFNALLGALLISFIVVSSILFIFDFAFATFIQESEKELAELISISLSDSVWEALNLMIIFGVSSIIALSLRSSRITNGKWINWTQRSYPFGQFISVCMISICFVGLVYLLFFFAVKVLAPTIFDNANTASALAVYKNLLPFIALSSITGLVSAWFVCHMTDFQKKSKKQEKSIHYSAVTFSVVFSVASWSVKVGVHHATTGPEMLQVFMNLLAGSLVFAFTYRLLAIK